jgi:integrase
VADLLAMWQDARTGEWQPTTARDHRSRAARIVEDIGTVRLVDIDPLRVDAWLAQMRRRGVGAGAIRGRVSTLPRPRGGPILCRRDGQRLDRRTAHRWVRSIGKRAGLGAVHPHMLRTAFIMAALDAGVPLRDVQIAARHADPRTTTIYDRRRQTFDRHAAYAVVAFVAGG